jgi:hypothetical protein
VLAKSPSDTVLPEVRLDKRRMQFRPTVSTWRYGGKAGNGTQALSGGAASAAAPKQVYSSGRLVVAASKTTPIPLRPRPHFFSEHVAVWPQALAGKTMTSAVAANWTEMIAWLSACCRAAVSVAAQACP